jgi:hypothetical protein
VIVELPVVDDAEVDVGRLVVIIDDVDVEPLVAVTEDNEVNEEIVVKEGDVAEELQSPH